MENTCDDDHLLLLLPLDVLIQILVLLPVISLLRFKSVCKSWRALIESSLFIDLHINTLPHHNSYSSKFGTFIFQTSESHLEKTSEEFVEKVVSEAFMISGEDDEENKVKFEDLCFPTCYKVSPPNHEILMVGSWNGLICIHDKIRRDVSLWNPATRQFRLLPKSLTLEIGDLDDDFVAFGYDVKTKDYKVLQISCFRPYLSDDRWLPREEYIYRVQVYNLSTDSWRLLEGINSLPAHPYQPSGCNQGVYLNGSYYFLGMYLIEYGFRKIRTTRRMIFSFDFAKESFTTMQHPDEHHLSMILTYLGEKLAVFAKVNEQKESGFESYDIWVLNKHAVKESWTKVHSIGPLSGIPRGISNNGEFAFIATTGGRSVINGVSVLNRKLQLLNLDSKEVKVDFRTGLVVIRTNVYKQSLVSVGGNGAAADRMIGGAIDLPQTFTIHGLWPSRNGGLRIPKDECPFSRLDLSSLKPQVLAGANKNWPNIAHFISGRTNVLENSNFWSAEWSSHGVCSNLIQNEYFGLTLKIYADVIPIIHQAMQSYPQGTKVDTVALTGDLQRRFNGYRPRLVCKNTNTNPQQQLLSEIRFDVENTVPYNIRNAPDSNCNTSIPVYLP